MIQALLDFPVPIFFGPVLRILVTPALDKFQIFAVCYRKNINRKVRNKKLLLLKLIVPAERSAALSCLSQRGAAGRDGGLSSLRFNTSIRVWRRLWRFSIHRQVVQQVR